MKIGIYFPITSSLLVLWTLSYDMPILNGLETTSRVLTTNTGVVSTTLGPSKTLTTMLIGIFSSGILTIVLTFVLRCRCTRK